MGVRVRSEKSEGEGEEGEESKDECDCECEEGKSTFPDGEVGGYRLDLKELLEGRGKDKEWQNSISYNCTIIKGHEIS